MRTSQRPRSPPRARTSSQLAKAATSEPACSGPVGDGVVRLGGGMTDLGEGFSLMVDGQLHSYLRRDPRVLPLAGYLAYAVLAFIV